jgi:Kef-type K+ transport system membrane component KefB
MFENVWLVAAIWIGLAFAASLISIRLGISVALIEIMVGVFAGNFLGIHETAGWIDFLAMLGSGVLVFLAGAEIDPVSLKMHFKSSMIIGFFSFMLPFLGVWMFTQHILGWGMQEAQIAGIALSTTSVAVVYAVLIEKGMSNTPMGKMILAACFITDLGTVLALGILFADFNIWMLVFVIGTALVLFIMPKSTNFIIKRYGANKVSEPEVKYILMMLFFLGWLATMANSEAVLPAYLLGLVTAGVFMRDKTLVNRMRSIAFAMFTPFYFIKAGLFVSLPMLWSGLGLVTILLIMKMITKGIGVYPLSRYFKMRPKEANYTTLLMSTGLTFGTISALFGLNNEIITQTQYTILVTVVILSAVIPTIIAQKFFEPGQETMEAWGRLQNITKLKNNNRKRI